MRFASRKPAGPPGEYAIGVGLVVALLGIPAVVHLLAVTLA